MKKIVLSVSLAIASFISEAQVLSKILVVPEYSNQLIKAYTPGSYPAADINYTKDLSGLCSGGNPNCIAIQGNDLFVSISSGGCQRIYKYANYVTNPASSAATLVTNYGNDYVGITFDANGNLYTAEGNYGDNNIVCYLAANNYAAPPLLIGNAGSSGSYFADLAFDASGNLWANDYNHDRIVVFDAATIQTSKTWRELTDYAGSNISNTNSGLQANSNSYGSLPKAEKTFSRPEGIDFDAQGNLWIANNNDNGANPNFATLVKIEKSHLTYVLSQPVNSAVTFTSAGGPTNEYEVFNVPNSSSGRAQLGGLQIDRTTNRMYVNEQVSGAGMYFDIATLATISTNFNTYKLSIVSTNPGNGGLFLMNNPIAAGLHDNTSNSTASITLLPNPAFSYLSITSSQLISEITIRDLSGKNLNQTNHLNGFTATISVKDLPKGIYFVEIKSPQGSLSTQKLIIQ